MRLRDRLKRLLLRWDTLAAGAAIALPFVAAVVAGFLWFAERGLLLPFIGVSLLLSTLVAVLRWIAAYLARRREPAETAAPREVHVPPDSDWSARETRAYGEACRLIAAKTHRPIPWPEFQQAAVEVIAAVATASGKAGQSLLDFTAPEALLLIERVSSRLRGDLRRYVPFVDGVSLSTLEWFWRHRGKFGFAYRRGFDAWRVVRMIKSPPAAILRELDNAIAGGHADFLTQEALATLQGVLLEEIARAAVDLYSGRLKFSESELLDLRLADGALDRTRLTTPDAPLRIAVAGQVSAGKSTLINALLGGEDAETDILPTTDRPTAHPFHFAGVDAVLLDLPGLDGGKAARDAVAAELDRSDIVLWVARADQPAREIDRAAIAALRARFTDQPALRPPPLVPVVTRMDVLLPGWPFAEHHLPHDAVRRAEQVTLQIEADLDLEAPPIPVVPIWPEWNLDALRTRLQNVLIDGLTVQRNRARQQGMRRNLSREAGRAAEGVRDGLARFGRQLSRRGQQDDPG